MAGIIIDYALLTIVLVLCCAFFIKIKSYKLLAIYAVVFLIYGAVFALDHFYTLELAKSIVQLVAIFGAVAMVSVYQPEFKTLFFNLSKKEKSQHREYSDEDLRTAINEIVKACQNMSKVRTGALIVIAHTKIARHILDTGTDINGKVTAPLLESIFNTKAPLHDGAVVIKGNQILAAGCFLPLSQAQNLSREIGTRHRAAIGITEETDMLSIVVSEENGIISIAQKGALKRFITPEKLTEILSENFGIVRVVKKKYLGV